jgi:hypothetical protein
LGADGSIHPGRNKDSTPGSKRKIGNSTLSAGIVAIGQLEKLGNRALQKGTKIFLGQEQVCGIRVSNHRRRKITAVHGSILRDIAANICELHGNAEVYGMGVGDRIANIQHTAHHDAYGAGHPIRVAKQSRLIRDTNRIKIRKESFDKLENHFGGNTTLAHEVESIAKHSIRRGPRAKSIPSYEKIFPCGFAR